MPKFKKNELLYRRALAYELFAFWGRIDEARSQSRALLKRIGPSLRDEKYFEILDRYLRGDAKENELLDAATLRIHRIEAHYLFGLTRLADGDRVGAIREFEHVEREGNFIFAESRG